MKFEPLKPFQLCSKKLQRTDDALQNHFIRSPKMFIKEIN